MLITLLTLLAFAFALSNQTHICTCNICNRSMVIPENSMMYQNSSDIPQNSYVPGRPITEDPNYRTDPNYALPEYLRGSIYDTPHSNLREYVPVAQAPVDLQPTFQNMEPVLEERVLVTEPVAQRPAPAVIAEVPVAPQRAERPINRSAVEPEKTETETKTTTKNEDSGTTTKTKSKTTTKTGKKAQNSALALPNTAIFCLFIILAFFLAYE